MESYQLRIIIADDHPLVVEGLKMRIACTQLELVGVARNSTELVGLLEQHPCDVLVTDYSMPGGEFGDGLAMLGLIRRRYSQTHILVMTMLENPGVLQAIGRLGVSCIISKSDDLSYLVPAIHVAGTGGTYHSPTIRRLIGSGLCDCATERRPRLSTREAEVVRLYASGMGVNEIASQLRRCKQTISSQKCSAMRKIGVIRDSDLIKYAMSVGLISPPG